MLLLRALLLLQTRVTLGSLLLGSRLIGSRLVLGETLLLCCVPLLLLLCLYRMLLLKLLSAGLLLRKPLLLLLAPPGGKGLGLLEAVFRRWGRLNATLGWNWASCYGDGRPTVVLAKELLAVLRGFLANLELGRHGRNALFVEDGNLLGPWTDVDPPGATVVGDASYVVDGDVPLVYVTNVGNIYAVYGAVVEEVVAAPVASLVSGAGVAVAIVDASVEADVASPEATMKAIAVGAVTIPVTGGPKRSRVRCSDPGAGYPEVACAGVVPVAGSPKVIRLGGGWLLILRKWWRWLRGFLDCVIACVDSGVVAAVVVVLL